MAELVKGSGPNQRRPDQSRAPDEQAQVPSTGESRQDIQPRLLREARPNEQAPPQTTTATDPRAEQVLKLQECFQRDAVHGSSTEQRDRLSAILKTSQDLLAQYQHVNEQIKTLGPNADPATPQDLQTRADLLIKQSAATLLHANTERTVDGIDQRQERLSQAVEKLEKEIQELEKLDERDPRRLAGILEIKKDQLHALGETKTALETIKSSLSSSLATSDSFLKRATELGKEQPISAAHLAEANANIDSGLLVLEDADRKTSLQAIDTGLHRLEEAQRQEIERREAFAQNIARYDQQAQRLQEAGKASSGRAQSNINDALRATGDITTLNSSWKPFQGFVSWVTGTTSAMETSRDNLLSAADEQNTATGQLLEERKSVMRAREEYIKWTRSGFEAEKQGDVQKAQALFNQAAHINQATADLGNPESISQTLTHPSKNWQQRNREVTRQLDAAVESANQWEAGLEVARNVTVGAGATVATIATAGAGAGLFLSFAAGSAGGVAIGSLSNTTEQVTGVATGLKTGEEARADFKRRFSNDALTSIQSAGGTATGLGAGRVFQSSSLASKLSTTVARPLTGAIGGGSSGTTTTAIDAAQTLYRRNEAIAEFNGSPAAQGLSPEARQAALDARLSELGLGLDDLAKRGVVNIGVGLTGGAIGANTGAMRDTAKTSLAKVSSVVIDTGADLTLGLGATLVTDGSISFEQGLAQSLQSVFVGNALSSLPTRAARAAEASSQPAKTKVNYLAGPESLRERFVSDSISQLTTRNGRPPTPEEVAQIKAESKLVRAYENPHTGEINVLKIDTLSMSRMERVVHASDIVHELSHRRGGDEFIAHKSRFEYLLKNGYQPELIDGQINIRPLGAGESGTLPTDTQIREHVARNYPGEESAAGMHLLREDSFREQCKSAVDWAWGKVDHKDSVVAQAVRDALRETLSSRPPDYKRAHELVSERLRQANESLTSRFEAGTLAPAELDRAGNEIKTLEGLQASLEVHPDLNIPRPLSTVELTETHVTNAPNKLKKYISLFNSVPTEKERLQVFLEDISRFPDPHELKLLQGDKHRPGIDIRSNYVNPDRFHTYTPPGVVPNKNKQVWVLEVGGGDRVIVGFDKSCRTATILYTECKNPHLRGTQYKPVAVDSMKRFLRR
jgi:hypothetical protein